MAVEHITAEEAGRRLTKLAIGVIGPGLPRRRRDQWILLYGAAKTIEPGETLDEKSLNEKLKVWLAALGPHTSLDHVTVRRALVDESFVERSPDGAIYRRSRAHERWVVFEEVAMPNVTNTLASERCTACRGDEPRLNESEIAELALGVKDWMVVQEDDMLRLRREFTFRDFAHALAFTNQVGALAEKEGHHPALLTEWGKVTVSWWTHKIHGLHRNDFVMAAKTDQLAT